MSDTTPRPRCLALTKAGDQCRGRAAHGTDYCGPHGPHVGRPIKLDAHTIEIIAAATRAGHPRHAAATAAGIHTRTLYTWLAQAEADADEGLATVYAQLHHALARAEAEAEVRMVELVRAHAVGDWKAAAWILERRHPERYGRRDKVDVSGEVRVGTPEVVVPEDESARQRIARILADAGALGGTA